MEGPVFDRHELGAAPVALTVAAKHAADVDSWVDADSCAELRGDAALAQGMLKVAQTLVAEPTLAVMSAKNVEKWEAECHAVQVESVQMADTHLSALCTLHVHQVSPAQRRALADEHTADMRMAEALKAVADRSTVDNPWVEAAHEEFLRNTLGAYQPVDSSLVDHQGVSSYLVACSRAASVFKERLKWAFGCTRGRWCCVSRACSL